MRVFTILALFTALTCNAQEPAPQPAPPPTPIYAPQDMSKSAPQSAPQSVDVQQQAPIPAAKGPITVPQGTSIPMVLTTPINTHSTHSGDSVRAETSFPVTVNNQLAIPAGTYAEGQIAAVHRPNSSHHAAFRMQFTRLIFANGYAEARLAASPDAFPVAATQESPASQNASAYLADINDLAFANDGSNPDEIHSFSMMPVSFAMFAEPQQLPPQQAPPPLPHLGPSRGLVIGIGLAALAAVVVTVALLSHHNGRSDLYLDAGSKIDLILQSPLTLDAASVSAAAVATPNP